MKPVLASVLLEDRLLTPNDRLECRGTLHLNGQTFHCQQAHGQINLTEALTVSCNLFFVQASRGLSARRFLHYAARFGLEQSVQGEAFRFPDWTALDGVPSVLYGLGLHEDFQPSALQLLRLSARLARRQVDGVTDGTWQILQTGMRHAVLRGTAQGLDPENRLQAAAKTGTAPHGQSYQSWLIGYFPTDAPRYAFCLRAPAGTAKDVAVPRARAFLYGRPWP